MDLAGAEAREAKVWLALPCLPSVLDDACMAPSFLFKWRAAVTSSCMAIGIMGSLSTAVVTRSDKKMEKKTKNINPWPLESRSSAGLPCMTRELERCRYGRSTRI